MVKQCGSKINIGLQVVSKRSDGYHDLKSIFYPLPFGDIIELQEADNDDLTVLGNALLNIPKEQNLVWKCWAYLKKTYSLPSVHWYLFKTVPPGTGIGAGSADLVGMLHLANSHFMLGLSPRKMEDISLMFGSDTGFFVANEPAMVSGRGDIIESIPPFLAGKYLVLLKPKELNMSTAEAFSMIAPGASSMDFKGAFQGNISKLSNDFQPGFEAKYPVCLELKQRLQNAGAYYVSLSGSGSCWYGLFNSKPPAEIVSTLPVLWQGML